MSKKSYLYIICGLIILLTAIIIVLTKGMLKEYKTPEPVVKTIEEQAVEAAHDFTRKRFVDKGELFFIKDSVVDRTYSQFRFDIYQYAVVEGDSVVIIVKLHEFKTRYGNWLPDSIYIVKE